MDDPNDKDQFGWKPLVAVSAMPLACGFMFIVGRTKVTYTLNLDAIFQGACTLVAAGLAAWFIVYQVRRTFENERELRKVDRARAVRDRMIPLREELISKRNIATDLRENFDRLPPGDFARRAIWLADAASIYGFRDAVAQSDQRIYLGNLDVFSHVLQLVRNLLEMNDRVQLRSHLDTILTVVETMLKDFDNRFPPE